MNKNGEWLFRLCAWGLTWFVAGLVTSVLALAGLFFGVVLGLFQGLGEGTWMDLGEIDFLLVYLLAGCLVWIYFFPFSLFRTGQTMGMRLFGLRLVALDRSPAPLGNVLFREVLRLMTLPVAFVGEGWMLLDGEERSLYDKASRTRVVQCEARIRALNEFREDRDERAQNEEERALEGTEPDGLS